MKMYNTRILLVLLFALLFTSCIKETPVRHTRAIAGIANDVETFNPLYAFDVNEGNITELLYLSLVQHRWNNEKGEIETFPMLAKSWQWSKDSSSIILELRTDVKWSDGVSCTAKDFVFSLDAYSDPVVQSKLFGAFEHYYRDKDDHVDINKTCEILSPHKLKINFLPGSVPTYFDFDFPLIPEHIYSKIDRKDFKTAPANFKPVTNGAFKLKRWDKNQVIVLRVDRRSFLFKAGTIDELTFKIIPDYNVRLLQLKNGEIDIMEDVKAEDSNELEKNGSLKVVPVKGREYEYIGWNNADLSTSGKPNKYFGSSKTRIALTYAVNRKEILKEFLKKKGEIAVGPVSPIFKEQYNKSITPYEYNPAKAKELLKEDGWIDKNKDGILEKGKVKFSFTLMVPSGNPRRSYAATIIKNNLREVGIEINIEEIEMGAFINSLYEKKFDAWIAAWFISLPVDLKPYWHSDGSKYPLNFATYKNSKVDSLLELIDKNIPQKEKNNLYKEFQEIINADEPVTFLYWIDNIAVYNSRLANVDINPLGVIHHCWNWAVNE